MRACLCAVLWLALSTVLFAQNSAPQPPHRACMMCHLQGSLSVDDEPSAAKNRHFSYAICMSCHDGQIAEEPNLPLHLAHADRRGRPGLNCSACHDPHDRSNSYRLLRAMNGRPQTEQSAAIEFCRGCHSDH